jgi:hypothetical protein
MDPLKHTALNLVRGMSALLGTRITTTKTYADGSTLDYLGYDPSTASLLDVAYGLMNLLSYPNMDELLDVVETIVRDHEPEGARLLEAVFAAADLAKGFPGAKLVDGSTLYDDLVPVIMQILAEPGMAEELMRALENPAVATLAQDFGSLMSFATDIEYDTSTAYQHDCNPGCNDLIDGPTGGAANMGNQPVDYTQPDSDLGGVYNRSEFERILHLVADSDGVTLCNKDSPTFNLHGIPIIGSISVGASDSPCELFQIDDLAVFYVDSIVGAANLVINNPHVLGIPLPITLSDSQLEDQSYINGFTSHPTPQALGRVLLMNPPPDFISGVMDPAVDKDGNLFVAAHEGTLQLFDYLDIFPALAPIVQVFVNHGQEHLFVETMVVLHNHWPSRASINTQYTNPASANYAFASDIHSYEPLLGQILFNGDLWPALTEGAPVIDSVRAWTGRYAPEVLTDEARFLFNFDPNLANRAGQYSTTREDGVPVSEYSPWYVLADAEKTKRAQLAASGSEGQLWLDSLSQVIDVLARGENAGGTWRFRNPRFRGVSIALIDFLRDRLSSHGLAGDTTTWARQTLPTDLQDVTMNPAFAGAADFVLALSAKPEAQASIEDLLSFLTTESSGDPFTINLAMAADMAQLFLDDGDLIPIAHTAGRAIDPDLDQGLVASNLKFMQTARHADTNGVLAGLIADIAGNLTPDQTALSEIVDSISDVNRMNPYTDQGKPMTSADYQSVLSAAATFLNDEKRGLVKFIHIVQNRHVTQ